VRITKRMDFW